MLKVLNCNKYLFRLKQYKNAAYSTQIETNFKGVLKKSNYKNRKVMNFTSELVLLRSVYPSLVNEILNEQLCYHRDMPEIRRRYANLIDYTVNLDDKYCSTAVMTVRAYKLFEKPSRLNEDNLKLAAILGWCCRIAESAMIIEDDMLDNSLYRYNKPVWFRLPNVGSMAAFMDATFLKTSLSYLLFNHFASHPQYFNIHKHVIKNYATVAIVNTLETFSYKLNEYEKNEDKVIAYPFTIPVILGSMYLANIFDPRLHSVAEEFLQDLAYFLKVEDDIEGLYGKIEKHSTDAEEGQITWMAVQVSKRGTEAQKKIFEENYGKSDKESLSKIYSIYEELNLKNEFVHFKQETYEDLYKRIEDFPKELPPQPFLDILDYGISGGIRA